MQRQVQLNRCLLFRVITVVLIALIASTNVIAQESTDAATRTYHTANGFLQRGMNDLAVQEYRKFLQEYKNHEKTPMARYGLGVALYRLNNLAEAVTELQHLRNDAMFEFAPEVQLLLGQSYHALAKYEDAVTPLRAVLTSHSDHPSAPHAAALLIEAMYRNKQFVEIKDVYEQYVAKWANHAMHDRVDLFAGLAAYTREDFESAAAILGSLQRRSPESPLTESSAAALAHALQRSGKREQAIQQYQAVIKQPDAPNHADALLALATMQFESDAIVAARLLDEFIAKHQSHARINDVLLMRGRLHFDQGEHKNAQQLFEQASTGNVRQDEAAYWIAKCQNKQQRFEQSAATLERALTQFPNSSLRPEMTYECAAALVQLKQYPKASQVIAQFNQHHSSHNLAADALYLTAVIEHQQKEYDKCAAACDAFMKKHGDHPLTAAVRWLDAENAFVDGDCKLAANKYRQFANDYPSHEHALLAQYRLGVTLHEQNQFDDAATVLKGVLIESKHASQFHRANLLLGDMAFQSTDWSAAEKHLAAYHTAESTATDADDAMLKHALAIMHQHRDADALQIFTQLLKQYESSPHRAQAYFEIGQLRLKREELDEAKEAFQLVLKSEPTPPLDEFALHQVAAIEMKQKNYALAAQMFGKISERWPDSERTAGARFNRAGALMAANDYEEAIVALKEFIDKHPAHARNSEAQAQQVIALAKLGRHEDAIAQAENISVEHRRRIDKAMWATVLYEKAWCCRALNRQSDAIANYEDLIALQDRAVHAHASMELAEILAADEQCAKAIAILQPLCVDAKEPQFDVTPQQQQQALYQTAVCHFQLKQFDRAAAVSEELIKSHPQSTNVADAYALCGESHFQMRQWSRAVPHLVAVVNDHKEHPSHETCTLRLGECYASLSKWKESEAAFTMHRDRYPGSAMWFQAIFGIGWARENQEQFDDAIANYRRIVERHSGVTAARAQFQIGECLFAQGKHDDAVRELVKVDILYSEPQWSVAALYEAGRCLEELGRPDQARAHYEQVRDRFAGTQWHAMAVERLKLPQSQPAAEASR